MRRDDYTTPSYQRDKVGPLILDTAVAAASRV